MAKTRTVELIAKLRNNMTPGLRKIASGAAAAAAGIAAITAAVYAAAKKLSDYGAEIYDLASATGVSVESIQALGYAFEQTGGSMSSMSGAIRGLNTFMRTAATGSKEYMDVLAQLGLSYDALRAMEPEQAFLAITDSIGGLDSAMERNIAATTIFGGRYAQQITGALDQADGSLRNLTESFEESGNALSGEQIESLKKYSDAMTDLKYAMEKLVADALEPMLPKLQNMADKGMELAKEVLPELIPMIETALDVMMNNLPEVIQLLEMTMEGWQKVSDAVHGVGSGEAEDLMNALTAAVEAGAISADEAADEWDKLTRTQRGTISTVEGMINPIANGVHVIDDLTAANGWLRQQQATVSAELDNTARAAFAAAEGINSVETASRTTSASAVLMAGAMGNVALAYSNFVNAGIAAEETPAETFGNANTEATKLELTTKMVLENLKEFVKPLIEAKDLMEKHSEMEDELRQNLIERKISEAEADAARQASLDKANASAEKFASSIIAAAMQGKDAWSAFWDNMKAKIIMVLATKGLMAFLNAMSGGTLGGIIGGISNFFGFKGGGTVPHYSAAGGMTVPGSTTAQGDKVPMLAEAGEMVLSRNQVQDLQAGGGSNVSISVEWSPMFSDASPSEVARIVPILKNAMQKGGLV